jgi:HTH-type transcriptional regulator/antitoxin HigA
LPESDLPEAERKADEFATELLVPKSELDDFIARIRPLYSRKRIIGFANRVGVHPGIVVGQLQHRKEIGFWHSRPLLPKVTEALAAAAMSDGWGYSPA